MKKRIIASLYIFTLISTILISEPFSFVVMGDSRPPTEEQPYVFYKVLDKINELEPDLVFSTGDIIIGYTEDRQKLSKMYDDFEEVVAKIMDFPLYIVPGNHDNVDVDSLKNEFTDRFGPTFQSIKYENSYFIILSSEEPDQENQIIGKQKVWLQNELRKAQAYEHIFVLVHQPLYPKIEHIGRSLDKFPEERDELAELLKKSKVDMVFAGHIHIYNYTVKDGLHQIITGGAGAPLYADTPGEGGFYHFIQVLVNGDDVDYRIVPVESEVWEAEKLIIAGYYEKAIEQSMKAMEYLPEHPESCFPSILGYKLLNQDFPAKTMYDKLRIILNNDFKTASRFAYFCYDLKFYDLAEEYFLKSTEIDITSYDSFYRLGRIKEKTEDHKQAIEYYQKALFLTDSEKRKQRLHDKIEKLEQKKDN
ncbi:MAG TPA: hypothetical protein ENL20_03535 [Candidatus Cloacimonetes bacterium]|nr:hypothetical protein [Candidatus Cloacimonadota bacterium]